MAENRGAHRGGPTQALQFTDSDKWVLFERGMAFVVEVVQEGRGFVKLDEVRAGVASEAEAVRLRFAASCDTGFDGEGVLAQAFTQSHSVRSCQAWARP